MKTSIELNRKSDWNPNAQKVRSSEPNYAKWNDALEKEPENAKSKYRELKEEGLATADKIKHEITASEKSASFLAYARQRTEEIYNAGGIRNWKKYNGFCNKLETYQTDKNGHLRDLTFAEITPAYLAKFEDYFHTLHNEIFPMLDSNAMWAKATTQEEKDVMPAELKKVLFSQISAKTALINKELKKIAALAGIDKKIFFHVSRHSFAKVAKQKGVDNSKVKELLAHSSLKITEGYMGNFDTAENDKALENIFEDTKSNIDEVTLLKQLQSLSPETLAALLTKVS